MTADLSPAVGPDPTGTPATRGPSPLPADARHPSPADATRPADDSLRRAPVLRPTHAPVNQLDFDDRHDTRATESDELSKRYVILHKDRRKGEWHRVAMGLVVLVVGVTVYLAGFVVVSRLVPNLSLGQELEVVTTAFVAAGGGVAGRALIARLRSRGGGPKSV